MLIFILLTLYALQTGIKREEYPYGECKVYTDAETLEVNAYIDTVDLPIQYSDKVSELFYYCDCCFHI